MIPERTKEELIEISPWLPPNVKDILDIGCGPGYIDFLLAKRYPHANIMLMDGDGSHPARVGYRKGGTLPWNDVEKAVDLVRQTSALVTGYQVDPTLTLPADIIISFQSWGYHYPIEVYLPLVKRSLRNGGRLIMDIRNLLKSGDGLQRMIDNGFSPLATIIDNPKFRRIVFA